MSALRPLENSLHDVFVKSAPPLLPSGKKWLIQYLPWINLVLGLFTLYAVYLLWHWAHYTNSLINYANSLSSAYGGQPIVVSRLGFGVWLGLIVLAIEAVLYIAAFPAIRMKRKSGWNLLFYAFLINVIYGVIIAFTDYGGIGNLIGAVIGSGIGLYLLFQIRDSYTGAETAVTKK